MNSHQISLEALNNWKTESVYAADSRANKRLYVVTNLKEFSIYFEVAVKGGIVLTTSSSKDAVDTYNSY